MINFLFWNVCGPGLNLGDGRYTVLQDLVREAVQIHRTNIVVLAESPFQGSLAITGFVETQTLTPPNPATGCRLEMYIQNSIQMTPIGGFGRGTIQEVNHSGASNPFLLAAVHLGSMASERSRIDRREREGRAIDFSDEIIRLENSRVPPTRRTLVVGDFNYEPYDLPLVYDRGFNAVSTKAQAKRKLRNVKPEPRPYFYNPMWRHFGDAVAGPAGTYCYDGKWSMPDQILIRPDLLRQWSDSDLAILSSIGKTNLLNRNGMPISKKSAGFVSDHLPVVFCLDL